MIVLVFSHIFHKELINCTQILGHSISPKVSTTKYIYIINMIPRNTFFFWVILLLYLPLQMKILLHFISLYCLFNSVKSLQSDSYRFFFLLARTQCLFFYINFVLLIQIFMGFSSTGFYEVLDHRKKIKTRFSWVTLGLKQVKPVTMSVAKEYSSGVSILN